MFKFRRFARILVIGSLFFAGGFTGCTTKPNQEESGKLQEAKVAAESAERKLSELRQERMQLEQDLSGKQTDLQSQEKELDNLKAGK